MGTAEILSGVAVLISGGTLVVTYRLGVRSFNHEREMTDLTDARSLLAECATELARAKNALRAIYLEPLFPDVAAESSETANVLIEEAQNRLRALQSCRAAVCLRFRWDSPMVGELAAVVEAVEQFMREFELFAPAKIASARELARRDVMTERVNSFDIRADGFLKAAQEAVAAQLPPSGSSKP